MAKQAKRLRASDVLRSAATIALRQAGERAQSGQLPTLEELVKDAGAAAMGALVQAQAEPEEHAPDTERRPFIDAEGVAL
jgi:hypothetical protein